MAVLITFGAVFAGVVLTGFARPSGTTIALFSDTYCVPITDENRSLVVRYIRGSRSLRMLGLVAGAGTTGVIALTTDGAVNATFYLAAGYGLGAVTYELLRRPPGPGAAALSPRSLDDYVVPWINRLLYVTTAVGTTLYALSFAFVAHRDELAAWQVEGYRPVGGFALAGLSLAVVAGHRIIRAPQPVISPAIDAAQHAVRTAGLMSLVGLALMAAGALAIGGVHLRSTSAPSWLAATTTWIGVPLAAVSSVAGFFLAIRSLPRFAPFWRELPNIDSVAAAP